MSSIRIRLAATMLILSICPSGVRSDVVGGASGSIDLEQTSNSGTPVTVSDSAPVGLVDLSRSISLSTPEYVREGVSEVDYQYSSIGPTSARFDIHANTVPVPGSGTASADLVLNITLTEPASYRVDAEILRGWMGSYSITFNNVTGLAYWEDLVGAAGTFPLNYCCQPETDAAYNWLPYINQGVIPAGQYQLVIESYSRNDDIVPGNFEATASLTLESVPEPGTGLATLCVCGLLFNLRREQQHPRS